MLHVSNYIVSCVLTWTVALVTAQNSSYAYPRQPVHDAASDVPDELPVPPTVSFVWLGTTQGTKAKS